jgi:hypothetical protein
VCLLVALGVCKLKQGVAVHKGMLFGAPILTDSHLVTLSLSLSCDAERAL